MRLAIESWYGRGANLSGLPSLVGIAVVCTVAVPLSFGEKSLRKPKKERKLRWRFGKSRGSNKVSKGKT